MDLLLICRDALENSFISNLMLALEAKKAGMAVGILFTEAALCGLDNALDWSPLLRDRDTRMKIARNAKEKGIPIVSQLDFRDVDVRPLIGAARQAGVSMYACPGWVDLLGLHGKVRPEVAEISWSETLKMISEARKVIGSY